MLIVRGVNVWPSAVKDVVTAFRPDVSGELLISIDGPGPRVDPPVRVKVETGNAAAGRGDLAARIERSLRAKLVFSARVELVPRGALPRTQMKARLVERNVP